MQKLKKALKTLTRFASEKTSPKSAQTASSVHSSSAAQSTLAAKKAPSLKKKTQVVASAKKANKPLSKKPSVGKKALSVKPAKHAKAFLWEQERFRLWKERVLMKVELLKFSF